MRTALDRLTLITMSFVVAGFAGEANAKSYSKERGGTGGGPYEVVCNGDDYLVGLDYSAGTALDNVTPLCRPVKNGKWTDSTYKRKPVGGLGRNGQFQNAGPLKCEKNQYITSLHVWWDRTGIVHHFRMTCHSFDRKNNSKETSKNTGGEPRHDGGSACESGQFAIGISGRSGSLIDRLGLVCEDKPKEGKAK